MFERELEAAKYLHTPANPASLRGLQHFQDV